MLAAGGLLTGAWLLQLQPPFLCSNFQWQTQLSLQPSCSSCNLAAAAASCCLLVLQLWQPAAAELLQKPQIPAVLSLLHLQPTVAGQLQLPAAAAAAAAASAASLCAATAAAAAIACAASCCWAASAASFVLLLLLLLLLLPLQPAVVGQLQLPPVQPCLFLTSFCERFSCCHTL